MQNRVRPLSALLIMGSLLALLWVLEFLDQASGNALDAYGIQARELDGLPEIFTAPFLHLGWAHLESNSLPFLVLGFLVLLGGMARWLLSSLISIVSSGLSAWLLTPADTVILGASGLIFGWLTYILVRGVITRKPSQIIVGVIVLVVYGSVLWGVLPGDAGISWQAHFGGAVGGVLAAVWLNRRQPRPLPPAYVYGQRNY
ncbi:MAG: rhomboid family intramembrane serine protease [Propionibacteriaceae bacterium]